MRFLRSSLAMAAGLATVLVGSAQATIVATSGDVVLIAPPPSVVYHALESNTHAFAFDERQNVTLPADFQVDITVDGVYDQVADLTPGTIPAGTVVDSHFIHSDRVGVIAERQDYDGSVTLDGDIIGVSVRRASLDAGDPILGAPGTTYPTGQVDRQLELRPDGSQDEVQVEVVGRTVRFHLNTGPHADQIRVITQPEPRGAGQGCTPGYWKQSQHFDSWTSPYDPGDRFSDHFEDAFPGLTLLQVLKQGGGGLNALGRHTVSALLNAASGGVSFPFTPQDVIDEFNASFPGGDYEGLKADFEDENENGCPLN